MDKYVVLCDCDADPNPRIIAWIDDARPSGRVRIDSNSGYTMAARATPNKRGAMATYGIVCRGCGKKTFVSDATAADVIDRIAPVLGSLEVRSIPSLDQPEKQFENKAARAEWLKQKHDEIVAQFTGQSGARRSMDPIIPDVKNYETRHVIPYSLLCQVVTNLRIDDDTCA